VTGATDFVVSSFSIRPLGLLWQLDRGDRSAGFQLADLSGNNHWLELPASGATLVQPRADGGTVRSVTSTNTTELAARIPANALITSIVAWAESGSPIITVGSDSGSGYNDIASSVTLGSDPARLTFSDSYGRTGEVWITSSLAVPVHLVITYTLL
jgi:hypothetical protein